MFAWASWGGMHRFLKRKIVELTLLNSLFGLVGQIFLKVDINECPFSKARTDLRRLRDLQKEFRSHSTHFELLKNPSMYCDLATLRIQLYHKFRYSDRLRHIAYFGITEKSHTDIPKLNSIKIHVLSIYSFKMNLIQFPTKFETIFFILPIVLIF